MGQIKNTINFIKNKLLVYLSSWFYILNDDISDDVLVVKNSHLVPQSYANCQDSIDCIFSWYVQIRYRRSYILKCLTLIYTYLFMYHGVAPDWVQVAVKVDIFQSGDSKN